MAYSGLVETRFEAIPMAFSYAAIAEAAWLPSDVFPGFFERNLKLGEASYGQIQALEVKAQHAGTIDSWPQVAGATFMLLYVMHGKITFRMKDDSVVTLEDREAVHLPFMLGVKTAEFNDDLHLMQIAATLAGEGENIAPLLRIAPEVHTGPWEDAIVRNRAELFIRGDGPRAFFTYRDLGSAGATDRRIQTHDGDGASQDLAEGTGWHNHSMSQFFYVLGGAADIDVEKQGRFHLKPGDAMTLGRGMRHNVVNIRKGYNCIELCLPADYSTTPQEPA